MKRGVTARGAHHDVAAAAVGADVFQALDVLRDSTTEVGLGGVLGDLIAQLVDLLLLKLVRLLVLDGLRRRRSAAAAVVRAMAMPSR